MLIAGNYVELISTDKRLRDAEGGGERTSKQRRRYTCSSIKVIQVFLIGLR